MTNPSKIHYPKPPDSDKAGNTACGREAPDDRIAADPKKVTCGVCKTWAAMPNANGSTPSPTIVDRLAETAHGIDLDLGVDLAHDRAKTRALSVLAKKYPDEFRAAYRAELEQALADVSN